ncbi:hypothetical protein [Hwanghaeella sp.]|uniref:hypothetical protein n=1 Tax=Hwanghaeella sp. TaxID=2605943 RepID=UPI003CCC1483
MAGNKRWIAKLIGLLALGVTIAVLLSGSVVWFLAVLAFFVCANMGIRKMAGSNSALGLFLVSIGFAAADSGHGGGSTVADGGDAGGGGE